MSKLYPFEVIEIPTDKDGGVTEGNVRIQTFVDGVANFLGDASPLSLVVRDLLCPERKR